MSTYDINLDNLKETLKNMTVTPRAQTFFANELMKLSDPYVPFDTGALKASARIGEGGKYISYNTPYARYLWYGKLMVDPVTKKGAFHSENYGFWSRPGVPKELTDRNLNFSGAPLRGSYWLERAYQANEEELKNALFNYIKQEATG